MISRLLIVVVVLLASLPVIPVLVLWQQRPLWQYNTNGTANAVAMSRDGSYVAVGAQTGSQGGGVLFFNRAGPSSGAEPSTGRSAASQSPTTPLTSWSADSSSVVPPQCSTRTGYLLF